VVDRGFSPDQVKPKLHVTDFPVINVHVDELSSARIWQHKLCVTLSANVDINYRLPIKVYYHICTLIHIRIEIHCSPRVVDRGFSPDQVKPKL
jgi:hypothetical protein